MNDVPVCVRCDHLMTQISRDVNYQGVFDFAEDDFPAAIRVYVKRKFACVQADCSGSETVVPSLEISKYVEEAISKELT